ncbi:MAG: RNA methyltransferase [Pseudomonadota bacterium]
MANTRPSRNEVDAHLNPAPVFVLVEPQMGENIGATARAMLNFGVAELRLVRPRDGWPSERAEAMSSGALEVMPPVDVFEEISAAIADCQYVVATTARSREMLLPVLTPREAASEMKPRIGQGQKCAVLFGGERAGLSNEDVLRSDAIVTVPVNPTFASINLAQAAILIAYEWAIADGRALPASDLEDVAPAPRKDFDRLMDHLFEELENTSYFFPPERRPSKERNLRVALMRAGLTEGEVRSLRGVIKALVGRSED